MSKDPNKEKRQAMQTCRGYANNRTPCRYSVEDGKKCCTSSHGIWRTIQKKSLPISRNAQNAKDTGTFLVKTYVVHVTQNTISIAVMIYAKACRKQILVNYAESNQRAAKSTARTTTI